MIDVRVEEQSRDDDKLIRKWTIKVEFLPRPGECIGFPDEPGLFDIKDVLWEEQFDDGTTDADSSYTHHAPLVIVKELPL